jgi:hypothetical protein
MQTITIPGKEANWDGVLDSLLSEPPIIYCGWPWHSNSSHGSHGNIFHTNTHTSQAIHSSASIPHGSHTATPHGNVTTPHVDKKPHTDKTPHVDENKHIDS